MTASTPRWPVLLASCIAVLGIAYFWVGPEPVWEHRCPFALDATTPEGTGLHVGAALWPPGTECQYTFPNGTEARSAYVPWAEWLAVLLLAAAVGATASRLFRNAARPSRMLAVSLGVLTMGLSAVFAGPGVGVIVLVLAITAAIWLRLCHGGWRVQQG